MSISQMTYMSYFFTIIAVLFGATAVALFFIYDIRRCWQIVRGKRVSTPFFKIPVDRQKKHTEVCAQRDRTKKLTLEKKTQPLCSDAFQSTVLLATEETEPLETMYLVQDITMMDVQE